MKKVIVSLGFTFFLSLTSTSVAIAEDICGGFSPAPQCQSGQGGLGNGFFDPQMDPRFNPQVDPRFNPQADPRFNPQADPRFNPKADPRFNPGAKPCDLGIGENCSWYDEPQVVEDETYYPEVTPTPYEDTSPNLPTTITPTVDVEETDSGSIPVRNISIIALLIGYIFLWDSSLNLKGNIEKQRLRINRLMK